MTMMQGARVRVSTGDGSNKNEATGGENEDEATTDGEN